MEFAAPVFLVVGFGDLTVRTVASLLHHLVLVVLTSVGSCCHAMWESGALLQIFLDAVAAVKKDNAGSNTHSEG